MTLKNLSLILVAVFIIGCNSSNGKPGVEGEDPSSVFLVPGPIFKTQAYELYDQQDPGEQAKIRYLINLIRFSDCYFVRNNEVHSASIGSRWLEYKLGKYRSDAKTAKSFVDKVASYSRTSGKPYYIVFPDNTRYEAKVILRKELSRLAQYERLKKLQDKNNLEAFIDSFSQQQVHPLDLSAFRLNPKKTLSVGYISDQLFYVDLKKDTVRAMALNSADPLEIARLHRLPVNVLGAEQIVEIAPASLEGAAAVVPAPEPVLK